MLFFNNHKPPVLYSNKYFFYKKQAVLRCKNIFSMFISPQATAQTACIIIRLLSFFIIADNKGGKSTFCIILFCKFAC